MRRQAVKIVGILGTKWEDGPIEGYMLSPRRVFRFDMMNTEMVGDYDRRLFRVKKLLERPPLPYVDLQDVFKYPEPDTEAGKAIVVLDGLARSDENYWFVTMRNYFRGRITLHRLRSGFELRPRYDLKVFEQAKLLRRESI